jgi:spore coat polysaccharide biosynthesis protein SpsF (cytidylyltransferase family)
MNQYLNNLYILIQARVRSTRLPGKIFFQFCDELVIDRVIKIAKKINNSKNIFILSGNKKYNKILDYVAKENNVKIYYGSEINVFKRFLDFIKNQKVEPKYICRLTSDGYLIQPSIVKKMINDIKRYNYDYSYVKPLSHFAGEIVKTSLFLKKKNISSLAKEHVTWDFRNDPNLIVKAYNSNFCNLNHNNFLVLDDIKDFVKMKIIEKKFPNLKKLDCIKTIKKAVKYIN